MNTVVLVGSVFVCVCVCFAERAGVSQRSS